MIVFTNRRLTLFVFLVGFFIFINNSFASKVDLRFAGAKGDGIQDDTQALRTALNNYDTVEVPNNFQCLIKATLRLKSNNAIIGQNNSSSKIIMNADDFIWDQTFNPAAFVNASTLKYSNLGDFNSPNSRIRILNVGFELTGTKRPNMESVFRFSGVRDLLIKNCSFIIKSKTGRSHNAILDLHSAYENVIISHCNFVIESDSKTSGGGIWIQNTSIEPCKNVQVINCTFNVASKDEALGVYTTNKGEINDVTVEGNTFLIPEFKSTNVSILTLFNNVRNVKVLNNSFNIRTKRPKMIDGLIRLGMYGHPVESEPTGIVIRGNTFKGVSDNFISIKGYSGRQVKISDNKFKNQSSKNTAVQIAPSR